jgi:hypothetical protein
MSIETRLAELTAAITTLTEVIERQTEVAPSGVAIKPKTTKAKAATQPVEAVEPAPVEAAPSEHTLTKEPELALEDIMPAARQLVDLRQGDRVVEILKSLTDGKVEKISLLPADKRAAFKAAAETALEGLKEKAADPLA